MRRPQIGKEEEDMKYRVFWEATLEKETYITSHDEVCVWSLLRLRGHTLTPPVDTQSILQAAEARGLTETKVDRLIVCTNQREMHR